MTNDTLAPACRPARRGDAAQPPRLGAGGPAGWRDFAAARLLHCESRAAGHPRRHRRAPGRAAAGRVRVCVRERRRADHRRPARRPVRPQADVHDRDGRLRRRVDAVRKPPAAARCWSAAACCRACSPRSSRRRCSRRSAACSPAGAGARDGLLRFRVRPRGRDRSARRRRVDQPASVRAGWRAIFLVNLPIGILALIGSWRFIPESRPPKGQRIDVPGMVLLSLFLLMLVYPLTHGREAGWPLWMVACLVGALPMLGALLAVEARRLAGGHDPLLDVRLFRNPSSRSGRTGVPVLHAERVLPELRDLPAGLPELVAARVRNRDPAARAASCRPAADAATRRPVRRLSRAHARFRDARGRRRDGRRAGGCSHAGHRLYVGIAAIGDR